MEILKIKMNKKTITIKDFAIDKFDCMDIVKWEEIERVLGKKRYKEFCKFMRGQTCVQEGVYVCDVQNFLRHPQDRFFD
jgi:hypothetical protein